MSQETNNVIVIEFVCVCVCYSLYKKCAPKLLLKMDVCGWDFPCEFTFAEKKICVYVCFGETWFVVRKRADMIFMSFFCKNFFIHTHTHGRTHVTFVYKLKIKKINFLFLLVEIMFHNIYALFSLMDKNWFILCIYNRAGFFFCFFK